MLHVGNEMLVNMFSNVLKLSLIMGSHLKILRLGINLYFTITSSARKIDCQYGFHVLLAIISHTLVTLFMGYCCCSSSIKSIFRRHLAVSSFISISVSVCISLSLCLLGSLCSCLSVSLPLSLSLSLSLKKQTNKTTTTTTKKN